MINLQRGKIKTTQEFWPQKNDTKIDPEEMGTKSVMKQPKIMDTKCRFQADTDGGGKKFANLTQKKVPQNRN